MLGTRSLYGVPVTWGGGAVSFSAKYNNSDFVLFVHRLGRTEGHLYSGLHARVDMCGVLLNFIFDEMVRKRNFSSPERHT
jgi:hypothetical protein